MIVARVYGVEDALSAFNELPATVQNQGWRVALNAGGGVIRDAMAANARKESGLLRRSLKVKVTVPNASFNKAHHGKPAYAVIGASRNVVGLATFSRSGARRNIKAVRVRRVKGVGDFFAKSGLRVATNLRRPSRYAHLMERGAKAHVIKKRNGRELAKPIAHPGVKATRFMARAVASHGEAAKAKVVVKIKDAISVWAVRRALKVRGLRGTGLKVAT